MATLRILRKLIDDLSFTEDEYARFKIVEQGNSTKWDPNADTSTEIEIGPRATAIILETLEDLDRKNRLSINLLDVCEKFGYRDEQE